MDRSGIGEWVRIALQHPMQQGEQCADDKQRGCLVGDRDRDLHVREQGRDSEAVLHDDQAREGRAPAAELRQPGIANAPSAHQISTASAK